jgi:hypothetical protein
MEIRSTKAEGVGSAHADRNRPGRKGYLWEELQCGEVGGRFVYTTRDARRRAVAVTKGSHLALFNQGSRYPDFRGIFTPPISPSYLPKEHDRFELFLTSEIGQRGAGVLHDGVIEVQSDNESASLDVTAKLAFKPEHQKNLDYELFVYRVLGVQMHQGGAYCSGFP